MREKNLGPVLMWKKSSREKTQYHCIYTSQFPNFSLRYKMENNSHYFNSVTFIYHEKTNIKNGATLISLRVTLNKSARTSDLIQLILESNPDIHTSRADFENSTTLKRLCASLSNISTKSGTKLLTRSVVVLT
uniref:LAGLIDADG homing endonuclease n=1 Tax=Romanomermis culicivorax TaxID=13658 RepID=A0A915LC28_ROMCU